MGQLRIDSSLQLTDKKGFANYNARISYRCTKFLPQRCRAAPVPTIAFSLNPHCSIESEKVSIEKVIGKTPLVISDFYRMEEEPLIADDTGGTKKRGSNRFTLSPDND